METTIDEVGIQIESNSSGAISNLDKLAESIANLTGNLKSGLTELKEFNSTMQSLKNITDNISFANIDTSKLENSLGGLSSISKGTGLKSVLSQLKEFPEISKNLKTADIEEFTKNVNELTKSLKPLSEQMLIISSSFAMLPQNVTKATGAIKKLNTSVNSTKKSSWFDNLLMGKAGNLLSIGLFTAALSRLGNVVGGFVNESNAYIENMNLFAVSMGKSAEKAMEFVNNFSNILNVDPSNVMRYMGMFNSLAEGFGIASDKAYIMSKNLTQLSYDMSSYLNIPIDQAMQKIKSGFSGEIEPMRAVGIALDQATLQETAYALGINKRVTEMTRAQKTELLYYQMMTRTTKMQNDMARTLITPANAMRILQEQFTLLARAIGNIFIPILMKVIPYVMVLTKWLTALAQTIANALGFELPDIDYSSLSGASTGLEDIKDNASGANKEMNKMLAKFDDLNVIDFGKQGSAGAGVGAGGSLGIELPNYDIIDTLKEDMTETEEKLKKILPYIKAIGIAFGTWKISSGILGFLNKLDLVKDLGAALKVAAGWALILSGAFLFFDGIEDILNPAKDTIEGIKKAVAGLAIAVIGVAIAFGAIPALVIAIVGAITIALATVAAYADDIKQKINEVYSKIEEFLSQDWTGKFGTLFGTILNGLSETAMNLLAPIKDGLIGWVDMIKALFNGDWSGFFQRTFNTSSSCRNIYFRDNKTSI